MLVLGIESTAHTFGVGIVENGRIAANAKDVYMPRHGWGIHPTEAGLHHKEAASSVLEMALSQADSSVDDMDAIAYSAGPGMPPCLKAGMEFAKAVAEKHGKMLMPVNHCVAHIEIGRLLAGAKDPVTLYVSGGNTQAIAYASGKYRVFGETQDIPIGNAIDTFIREATGKYPGGPVMEEIAKRGKKYIELPYVVKGMDLSFSGILTAALNIRRKNPSMADLCYSFQETCYAMLTEVTERAMAHTGKTEAMVTGGVAASARLNEMLQAMCGERGARFYRCPKEFTGDNGSMIALVGQLLLESGQKGIKAEEADFKQRWRADEVDIPWLS